MELLGCAGSSCREMAAWAKAREMEQPGLPAQKSSRHSAIFPLRDSRDGAAPTQCFGGSICSRVVLVPALPQM